MPCLIPYPPLGGHPPGLEGHWTHLPRFGVGEGGQGLQPQLRQEGLGAAHLPAVARSMPLTFGKEASREWLIFGTSSGLSLHGRKGYVAGWGLTRNEECFTDNFGPERHARCRFPFIFNGEEGEDASSSLATSKESLRHAHGGLHPLRDAKCPESQVPAVRASHEADSAATEVSMRT